MYTYRDLIRVYADGVERGTNDAQLNPRERRLVALMLRTASNADWSTVVYPPTDRTRDDVVKSLSDLVWNGNLRLFITAVSPSSGEAFDAALSLTIAILRGI